MSGNTTIHPATNTIEQVLSSSLVGPSVLDTIVQANVNLNTVSLSSLERMIQAEQLRRIESGRESVDRLCAVCG